MGRMGCDIWGSMGRALPVGFSSAAGSAVAEAPCGVLGCLRLAFFCRATSAADGALGATRAGLRFFVLCASAGGSVAAASAARLLGRAGREHVLRWRQ